MSDDGQLGFPEGDDEQPALPEQAHARNTDPWTSHAAARSITPDELRASQRAVYECFCTAGPMHHAQMIEVYTRRQLAGGWPAQSESGLRTRTKELVTAGLLRDSGRTVLVRVGRKTHHHKVWEPA